MPSSSVWSLTPDRLSATALTTSPTVPEALRSAASLSSFTASMTSFLPGSVSENSDGTVTVNDTDTGIV